MKTQWLGRAALAVVIVAGATACTSDARFKKVTAGIGKDSVAVLSGGAVASSVAAYLTDGKNWEIQYFAKAAPATGDTLPWRAMTPVVYADNKVVGVGWSFWEKQAATLKIALPPK